MNSIRLRQFLLLAALLFAPMLGAAEPAIGGEGEGWLTNFADAKKQAKEQNKRVFMLFTGSDWCPYCKTWNKELFSQQEFKNYAKANLVLLYVDFPDKKPISKAQLRANEVLQDKYKIEGYPTAVILNADAKKIGQMEYTEGGFTPFLSKLKALKD